MKEGYRLNLLSEVKRRGFTEARVISTEPFTQWEAHNQFLKDAGHPVSVTMTANPEEVLVGATAIIVLMTAFHPYDVTLWPKDCLQVHPHYLTSNRQYQKTTELINLIRAEGYRAQSASLLPERHAALRAGYGRCGHMGLLIHPMYGSYICFHTIITDIPLAITHHDKGPILECKGCNLCKNACPTGAIQGNGQIFREYCLRYYAPIEKPTSDTIRRQLGMKYIGCDSCQEACMYNRQLTRIAPPQELIEATKLEALLQYDSPKGKTQLKSLQRLIGKNNARPQRVAAAAALHAGNRKDQRYAPHLIYILKHHPSVIARSHAAWALGKLGGYDATLSTMKETEKDPDVLKEIHLALTQDYI